MTLTKTQKILLSINIAVIIGFSWYYLQALNYEFFAYAITIAVVTVALFSTLKWTRFPNGIIVGVTIWGLMHMLGGSIMTADGVLYAWRILPIFDGGGEFYILKFDDLKKHIVFALPFVAIMILIFAVFRLPSDSFKGIDSLTVV